MELLETEKDIALISQSLNIEDMKACYWYRTDKPYQDAMLKTIRAIDILVDYEVRDEVERTLAQVKEFEQKKHEY